MNTNANLPIKAKNNLPIEKRRNLVRTKNNLFRIGKILAELGISVTGMCIASMGGIIAPIVGGSAYMLGGITGLKNIFFHKEKGLMFLIHKNLKGEICIFQDSTDLSFFSKMKGFQPSEKGVLMGLQMLIGLQNYKQKFQDENRSSELSRDGQTRVYSQIFKTKTHGINIKTIEALEKLGYIQIERNEPKSKSILFFERMEFSQYHEAMQGLSAKISGNKDDLSKYQKQIHEIAIKITDKQMDFEEIYKQYQEVKNTTGKNPIRKPLKRIGVLFDGLRNRNIDVSKNALGMYELNYHANESFSRRLERECEINKRFNQFRSEQKVAETQLEANKENSIQGTPKREYQEEKGENR